MGGGGGQIPSRRRQRQGAGLSPIVIEFEVDATPEHAFELWTARAAMWWPRTHSVSQTGGFEVVFEPEVGGRVYERGSDGSEHEWGQITVWDPPTRVDYLWHIFLERDKATKVSVTFEPIGSRTRVRLENSGFEVFGDGAPERRQRVGTAWTGITGFYRAAIQH